MITTLDRLTVTITGTLKKMDRSTAFSLIRNEGGYPKKKMALDVDVLIITDEKWNSSTIKIRKAMNSPYTEIMSESEFYDLVGRK